MRARERVSFMLVKTQAGGGFLKTFFTTLFTVPRLPDTKVTFTDLLTRGVP